MKRLFKFSASILAVGISSLALAQTANDLNEGLTIRYDSAQQEVAVSWWTQPNYFYFLLATEDLLDQPWAYLDYAVLGDSSPQSIIMPLPGAKLFFRVERTNDLNSPQLRLDHDEDKVSTADELLQGTDPFLSQSLDADPIPDDWETFHGLDTTPGMDSSGDDADGDGLINLSEFTLGTNPSRRDHPDIILNLY